MLTNRKPAPPAPAPTNRLAEYRPNRNFIRVRDIVHVTKGPGRRAFDSPVLAIRSNDAGEVTGVDVRDPHTGNVRTVLPEAIERKAQTRNGKPRSDRRA